MKKKKEQLGLNPGTASGRLVKDLLFSHVKHIPCYRCGGALTRDTFSVDHKTPWLDSENPTEVFFDLENISYSHISCNSRASRKPHKKYNTEEEAVAARCQQARNKWNDTPKEDRQVLRRKRYTRYGY